MAEAEGPGSPMSGRRMWGLILLMAGLGGILRWDGLPGRAEEVGEAVYGEVYDVPEEIPEPAEVSADPLPEEPPEEVAERAYATGFHFWRTTGPSSTEIQLLADPTGGVGATLRRKGGMISFFLLGTEGAGVERAGGEEVVFSVYGVMRVRYLLLPDRLKEEIILERPPSANVFRFRYRERGLMRLEEGGGVRYLGENGEELFSIPPPLAWDASGVQGAVYMRLEGEELHLVVDPEFLAQARYPLTVDPTVVYSSANSLATAYGTGRRLRRLSTGALVAFYRGSDGDLHWGRSTDNGATWTDTDLGIAGSFPAVAWDSGDNVHLLYENGGEIYYRKCTYSAGPSYNCSAIGPIQLSNGNGRSHYPSLALSESGGSVFLHAVWDYHYSAMMNYYNRVYYNRSTDGGQSWTGGTNITLNEYTGAATAGTFPSVVVDQNHDVYVTWFSGNQNFYVRRAAYGGGTNWTWGSSTWASFSNTGSTASTTVNAMMLHSAVIKPGGGEIALVLPNSTSTTGYQYKLAVSPTGSSSNFTVTTGLNGTASGDGYPSIASDNFGGYVVFLKDNGRSIAYYRPSGGSAGSKYTLHMEADTNDAYYYPVSSSAPDPLCGQGNPSSHRLEVIWTWNDNGTYKVRHEYLLIGAVSLGVDSTYNRDGTPGGGSVNFGMVKPSLAPFLVHPDADKHAVQLTAKGNVAWDLYTRATGDLTNGSQSIPIGRLKWRVHGSSDPWVPFQTTDYQVLSNQSATCSGTVRHDYLLDLQWSDPASPSPYSTQIVYTVAVH